MIQEEFNRIEFGSLYRQDESMQVVSGNDIFINFMYSMFPTNYDIKYRKTMVENLNTDGLYFPINLDDVYRLLFSRKDGMVKYIVEGNLITEGIDFIYIKGNGVCSPRSDKYMLSVPFVYWMLSSKYWIYGYDIVGFDIMLDWDLIKSRYGNTKIVFNNMMSSIGLIINSDYMVIPNHSCARTGKMKRNKIMVSLKSMPLIHEYMGMRGEGVHFKTYIIRDYAANIYKIGKSVDVCERLKTIYCCNPHVSLYAYLNENIEAKLHKEYKHKRISGDCEWFRLSQEDLDSIVSKYGFTVSPGRNSMKFS